MTYLPSVIARHTPLCHCEAQSAEAIPKLNPKLKALSPKQIPISKFKVQNRFGSSGLGHLIMSSISDLGFYQGIATLPPSLRSGLCLTAMTIHCYRLFDMDIGSSEK